MCHATEPPLFIYLFIFNLSSAKQILWGYIVRVYMCECGVKTVRMRVLDANLQTQQKERKGMGKQRWGLA